MILNDLRQINVFKVICLFGFKQLRLFNILFEQFDSKMIVFIKVKQHFCLLFFKHVLFYIIVVVIITIYKLVSYWLLLRC